MGDVGNTGKRVTAVNPGNVCHTDLAGNMGNLGRLDYNFFSPSSPVDNQVSMLSNFFSSLLMMRPNKLECLHLAKLFSLV
jgi:hypothetical protein